MSKVAYIYEIGPETSNDIDRGEIEARDESDARRRLRGLLGTFRLPPNTRLFPKAAVAAQEAQVRSGKLRYLLRILSDHHAWISGQGNGRRADLSRLNLSGVNLRKRNLADEITNLESEEAVERQLAELKARRAGKAKSTEAEE